MKRTQRKELLRSIWKNRVSFFAVAFIASTSIAIFSGMKFSAAAINQGADRYFRSQEYAHFEINCGNGLTTDDVNALLDSGIAQKAEGGYAASATMLGEDENTVIQVRSLYSELNKPVVVEGRLPEGRNEVSVEQILAEEKGIAVGDTLRLQHEGMLYEEEFVVSGIVDDPAYCCVTIRDSRGLAEIGTGAAFYHVNVAPEAFDSGYYNETFTVIYVVTEELRDLFFFSDAYNEKSEELLQKLEDFGSQRAALRYNDLKAEADAALAEAELDISTVEDELATVEADIAAAKQAVLDGRDELASRWAELENGRQYMSAEQIAETEAQLNAMEAQLQEMNAAATEAEAGLEDARAELETGRAELALALEEAEQLEEKGWAIRGRMDTGDTRSISMISSGVDGMSYSLAVVFLLVAVVICYSSTARMVDERRLLIGAQKALGFSPKEILRYFLSYSTLGAVLGIGMGLLLAVVVVEVVVIFVAYAGYFTFSNMLDLAFVWQDAALASALCLLIFELATYIVCNKLVRMDAIALLRGEVPAQKKPYFFEGHRWYRRLSLYSKAVIKNLFNDKSRAVVTIMGVVGSIALLVICFSLKMALEGAAPRQYEQYYLFENKVIVDSNTGNVGDFTAVLEREGVDYVRAQEKVKAFLAANGSYNNAHIICSGDEEGLMGIIRLEDIDSKATVEIPSEGILVSRRCREALGIEVGMQVEIADSLGVFHSFEVVGIVEHHLANHTFYVDAGHYEAVMGEQADESVLFTAAIPASVADELRSLDGFLQLRNKTDDYQSGDYLDIVIFICLAMSVIMAFLVILNQGAMQINRKARELAVMRINGFTLKETRAYIYRDNIVLTIIGLLLGCGCGLGLGYVVIRFVEVEMEHFYRAPNLLACLYACAIGAAFALVVNFIALRRINTLNLTNVNGN
ncbi:MAG: FtsX-like permease family protein [Clostridia bacterium]|nr:FtsX-like permease family protein [Clostridia bacterium]